MKRSELIVTAIVAGVFTALYLIVDAKMKPKANAESFQVEHHYSYPAVFDNQQIIGTEKEEPALMWTFIYPSPDNSEDGKHVGKWFLRNERSEEHLHPKWCLYTMTDERTVQNGCVETDLTQALTTFAPPDMAIEKTSPAVDLTGMFSGNNSWKIEKLGDLVMQENMFSPDAKACSYTKDFQNRRCMPMTKLFKLMREYGEKRP